MKKKIVSICLVLAILAVAATGTLAYFTDYDGAENTFVFGNISIQQLEKERIEQSDDNTDPSNVQDFTQDKELFPVVGDPAWADEYQQWETGGANQLFTDDMGNVEDKFVFVENDGANDVYFRTLIAVEQGDLDYTTWDNVVVGIVSNGSHYDITTIATDVVIGDSKYVIYEYVYNRDNGAGAGVLEAGLTSRPSLLQVLLYKETTQEQVALLDGNADGKLNVLVVSQAVQTAGFSDAATALDEAFGDLDAASAAAYLAEYKA